MNVEIYTLDYCPFCQKALIYLNEHNIKYTRHRIDDDEEKMLDELGKKFDIKGEVTVPQIIVDGKRLGGYSDLLDKHEMLGIE